MGWRIWTGKYQEEIRHLRGLVDEIMVICDDAAELNTVYEVKEDIYREIVNHIDLANVVLHAIEETQDEYEEANEDAK
mgnify:CR=1 FL=1